MASLPNYPELSGQSVLITGASSGIGAGLAAAFAAQGCHISVNYPDTSAQSAAENIVNAINRNGGDAITVQADVSRSDEVAAMMDATLTHFGKLDILVNNAGMQFTASIEDFPVDKWDQIIALNLSAAFHTTRLCLPAMRNQNFGRIINIASVHGLVASVNKPAYVAAKHGLVGFTKSTALETAKSNITCNAICPGWTHTPLIQTQIEQRANDMGVSIEEGGRALLTEKQPSEQFVTTDQLGALTRFLCTDAASQITGAQLPVDGGWTAQ